MGAHILGNLRLDQLDSQQSDAVSVITDTLCAEQDTKKEEKNSAATPGGHAAKPHNSSLPALASAFLDKLVRLQLVDQATAQDFVIRAGEKCASYVGARERQRGVGRRKCSHAIPTGPHPGRQVPRPGAGKSPRIGATRRGRHGSRVSCRARLHETAGGDQGPADRRRLLPHRVVKVLFRDARVGEPSPPAHRHGV